MGEEKKPGLGKLLNPFWAVKVALKEAALSHRRYLEAEAVERVVREEIARERDRALADIRERRAAMNEFLKAAEDRRAHVLGQGLAAMDRALEAEDPEALGRALDGLLTVLETSPFADDEKLLEDLRDEDKLIEI